MPIRRYRYYFPIKRTLPSLQLSSVAASELMSRSVVNRCPRILNSFLSCSPGTMNEARCSFLNKTVSSRRKTTGRIAGSPESRRLTVVFCMSDKSAAPASYVNDLRGQCKSSYLTRKLPLCSTAAARPLRYIYISLSIYIYTYPYIYVYMHIYTRFAYLE